MKKIFRICAMTLALLGATPLTAQTDVTDTYITNADFASTDGWTKYVSAQYNDIGNGQIGSFRLRTDVGTAATTDETHLSSEYCFGFEVRWANSNAAYQQNTKSPLAPGIYTLSFDVQNTNANTVAGAYGNLFYVKVGDKTYTDTKTEWMLGGTDWTTHSIEFYVASESEATISLGIASGSMNKGLAETPLLYVSHLKLWHRASSDVTETNAVDLASMSTTSWTNGGGTYKTGDGVFMRERYFDDQYRTGDMMTQSVTGLPVGVYNVALYANANWTPNRGSIKTAAANAGEEVSSVFANGESKKVALAHQTGTATAGVYTFEGLKITDGNLNLGIRNDANGANWLLIAVKSITYLGPDKTLYEEAFTAKVASLKELDDEVVPAAFASEISGLIATYGNSNPISMTLAQLEAANEAIDNVLVNYDNVVAANDNLNALIALCTDYTDAKNSKAAADVLTTFATAITTATEARDAAATAKQLTDAYGTLEGARQTYVLAAAPVYPYAFDITFRLTNPTFDTDLSGWTNSGAEWKSAGKNVERYNNTFDTYQTLSGLDRGTYEVSVDGFYRAGSYNNAETLHNAGTELLHALLYANTATTPLMSIMEGADCAGNVGSTTTGGKRVPNSPADGTIYFATGCYSNNKVSTFISEGELTVGIKKLNTISADWTLFDNFRLFYKGIDTTDLQATVASLKVTADELCSGAMGKTERTALNTAVTNADAVETDIDALETMADELQRAIASANAWVTAYNEAKAPLVAQLERFEADFNGADGCTEKVCASVWAACIAEVQAAAEAKDVTDSYDGFEAAAENLKKANDDVAASIAIYANLKKEIGYAEAYTLVDTSNQEDYYVAIDAANTFYTNATDEDPSAVILAMQQFKVLDYEYVAENFTGVYPLGEWNNSYNPTTTGQHWDGTSSSVYYDKWSGDANDKFSQTVSLPAGTYVLKAVGRASSGGNGTAMMKVGETTVEFPKKGDVGYGVNTDGEADFATTSTYANENKGRGWEYRFIEFTLTEPSDVTIEFGIEVKATWASICTPELLVKEIVIKDKEDFSLDQNITVPNVTYDREFAQGVYTTVMLPFNYVVPNGVVVEQLTDVFLEGENSYVKFEKVTEMVANTPYILKNTGEAAALFAELGETEIAATEPVAVTVDKVTMRGTYQAVSSMELLTEGDVLFFNTAGELKYIDNDNSVDINFPAFRAYIIVPSGTYNTAAGVAPRFTVLHGDDDVTAIEDTTGETLEEEVVYDLMGRRIEKPARKGIYIVNGKKTVIR